jgi:thiamine kinase-like enzyme
MRAEAEARASRLPCWRGTVEIEPLFGGISNVSFIVRDRGERFVVRLGEDVPVHGVVRERELALSRAAHAAGISPELVYAEPGLFVVRFIAGCTLAAEDVRDPCMLARIVQLVRTCHHEVPRYLNGASPGFCVFHAIRGYGRTLARAEKRSYPHLSAWLDAACRLEAAVPDLRAVLAHNDLLAANIIDDGRRLWLVDWEYGGFNNPLFDLANLGSNNELTPDQEAFLLEAYFAAPPAGDLARGHGAMRCASLLREAMWSLASELHFTLDFDYAAYADLNLQRFARAYDGFLAGGHTVQLTILK